MAISAKRGIGVLLTQIALALYLAVTGLYTLGPGGNRGSSQIEAAVRAFFSGGLAEAVIVLLGVVVLVCGILLALRLFWHPGTLDALFKLVTLVVWVVVAVVIDGFGFRSFGTVWQWMLSVAENLLIIGGLLLVHG